MTSAFFSSSRSRHGRSLERTLPLLIAAMLLTVLVVVLAVTYREIMRSSRTAAVERLQRVTHELSSSATRSVSTTLALMGDTIGNDSVIRRVLAGATPDSTLVASKLRRLTPASDTTAIAQLWSADGHLMWDGGSGVIASGPPETGRVGPTRTDSAHLSPLFTERGGVYYWIVAPVRRNGRRLGWITVRRRIASTPQAQRQIQGLIGEKVRVYFRNDSGSFWTTLTGSPVPAPVGARPAGGFETHLRPDEPTSGPAFVTEAPIAGTPWTLVLDVPVTAADATPHAVFMHLAIFTLVLLFAAVVVAWVVSRRLTRPLIELAEATESIARGDYSRRVDAAHTQSSDEIGRLAESFNHMIDEIAASHTELEQQIEEAQSMSEELESANAQLQETTLEAELARDEADVARRDAEDANRAKSAFLATMSHELRTPLNAIAGYAELLEMGIRGPITREQREDLERIRRSQRALLALVDDVLSFARIEAGRVEYRMEEVPLDVVLTAVENHIAPQARAKGISYVYRPAGADVRVWTDREKLERIVVNLLSNAVKFTAAGGQVVLESEECGDAVDIRVIDTGCGIAADKLDAIFEPFTQAEAGLTRRSEGTGLGLAISREFAHALGGELIVESAVNQGSTFTLRLPIRPLGDGGVHAPESLSGDTTMDDATAV